MTSDAFRLLTDGDPPPKELISIQPDYYEELLADRIRIKALEKIHVLMRVNRWGPRMGKWWIQGPGWFSKIVYGETIEETIDKWIALTVDDEQGS